MKVLEVNNIGKSYKLGYNKGLVQTLFGRKSRDQFWALKDVSFSLNQGEVLGILGRNGAGKSTLLKIISKITKQTEGTIKIKGRTASLLEVGTGFNPELSGRDNIFLNGTILGMTRREIVSHFDEIVEFSGLQKFLDTPVKRYSSGMRVRLGFAVAAHLQTEILIVDEVLAVGDFEFQARCLNKMDEVSNQGRTIIFVSHHTESMLRLCSRGIILSSGKLVFDGKIEQAVSNYLGIDSDSITSLNLSNRSGSGEIQFKSIFFSIVNSNNPYWKTGADCLVRVNIESVNNSERGKEYYVSLVIKDSLGKRICSLSSVFLNKKFKVSENSIVLEWEVNKLGLSAGKYIISAFIFEKPGAQLPIDVLEDCCAVDVYEGDYYGSNIVQSKGTDVLYLPFDIRQIQ